MKRASVAEAESRLASYVRDSAKGPIVITRKGKAVAVLVAVEDEDEAERLALAYSPAFEAIVRKSMRQIEQGKGIPHEEFWRQVDAQNAARDQSRIKRRKEAGRRRMASKPP